MIQYIQYNSTASIILIMGAIGTKGVNITTEGLYISRADSALILRKSDWIIIDGDNINGVSDNEVGLSNAEKARLCYPFLNVANSP